MSSTGRRYYRPFVSQVASTDGPLLLQDTRLVEELAHFNRERIPERVVHAKGTGAFGKFFLTQPIPELTRAKIFTELKQDGIPLAVRFSTVGGEKGSADTVRDPRGFAMKFYTEEGNLDLVCNNTPIFFIDDPILFPSLVHSQKRDPQTNLRDPDAYWDFLSSIPQSLHQICYLHSDRGIPDGYRHMHGFACHTFRFTPDDGKRVTYIKFHFKTCQGIKNLDPKKAEELAGSDPDYSTRDLFDAIQNKKYPKWTMHIQTMTEEQRKAMKDNPFDITTVWSQKEYPLKEIGFIILDRNPKNHFCEVEQLAFCPANLVPGIDPSPDRVLQGRIFAYTDAQRYRLGVNFNHLPVNQSKCPLSDVTYRDGAGYCTDNLNGSPNYYPNRKVFFPVEAHYQEKPHYVNGWTIRTPPTCVPYLEQTKQLVHRVLDEPARQRLAKNLATELNKVKDPKIIRRMIFIIRLASEPLADSVREKLNTMGLRQFPQLRPILSDLKEVSADSPSGANESLLEIQANGSDISKVINRSGDMSAYKVALLAAGIQSYAFDEDIERDYAEHQDAPMCAIPSRREALSKVGN